MKQLVITEKPSVAMDISKVLGGFSRQDGYLEKDNMIISWAIGHLVELAQPQDYDPAHEKWTLEALPILPEQFQLKAKPSTIKQLGIIKKLIARTDVNSLINACDAGREGELIFRNVLQFCNCRKPHQRLWLSETTPAAVRKSFLSLRTSDEMENLARAATARSQADWLVGINATRGYTAKHRDKLTVGRVQTPTLALIVNRDREIEGFVSQDYWEVEAEFNTGKQNYKGKWFRDKQDRFTVKIEAEAIHNKLAAGSTGRVIKGEQTEKSELPPMLLNLTDLQNEANKRYGYTAELTLQIAQKLYESHLITYPRTDSRHLTEAMRDTLPARLNALRRTEIGTVVAGITDTGISNKRYVDDTKVSDHTAIIITDVSPTLTALAEQEINIYMMVARRMVGMFLPPARIQQTTIITNCQGESFITKGKVILEHGWKVLYSDKADDILTLPTLSEGQNVTLQDTDILQKQTQPPKRYTEADLLSSMENAGRQIEDEELREAMRGKGLGTPATRAAIIEKLISTGYIARQKKALVATDKGKALIDIVAPTLKNPVLTGEWEKKLLDIEQGKYHSSLFMREIRSFIEEIIVEIKAQEAVSGSYIAGKSLGNCPMCGKPVIENKKAYGCSGWKEGCKFAIWKTIAGKSISQAQARKILQNGRSDLIKGFQSKAGRDFEAYLRLDCDRVAFEFPAKAKK